MLAKAIRKNTSIKGIFLNNREIKLSQYADDTTLILDGTKESLIASLKTLDDFNEVSGLKLNDKKKQKPFGLEQKVGTMEYQFLEEILTGLNTKLKH